MREKICKGRKLKRLLSVVLAVAMVVTLIPMNSMTVYAAEVIKCGQKLEKKSSSDYIFNWTSDNTNVAKGYTESGKAGIEGVNAGTTTVKITQTSMRYNNSSTSTYTVTVQHDFGAWTNYNDATRHKRTCSGNSNHIEYQNHSWNASTGKCSVCGYQCLHTGQAGSTCTVCGKALHICSVGDLQSGQAATCIADGWKDYYICSCGKIYASTTISSPYSNLDAWKTSSAGKIVKLGHDWNYSVDGAVLTATCSRKATCGQDDVTLTLTATSPTYSSSSIGLSDANLTGLSDFNTTTGLSLSSNDVKYWTDAGHTTATTSANSGAASDNAAPVKAGTYYATLTIDTDKTAIVSFEIKKVNQAATVSMSGYTYGDTPSTPSVSGAIETPSITYYYNTTNSNTGGTEWSGVTATTLEPNTYYMYAELASTDNYNAYVTPTVTFTVEAKTFTTSEITATEYSGTYDGNDHGISVVTSGAAADATVEYSTDNSTWSTTNPVQKDAGDYVTVYYRVSKRGYTTVTGDKTITITPKEITATDITWSNTSFTYNGSVQTPTATVKSGVLCGEDTCTINVTGGQKDASDSAYTATAFSLSNSNYKLPTIKPTKDFTIAKKEVGITWGTATFDYDGTKTQVPEATATDLCGSDTCTITVTGEQTNVGSSYIATAASLSNSNYKLPATGTTKAFEIKAIDMTVSTQDTSVTYDGSAYDISIGVTLPNKQSTDDYTIMYGTVEGTYNLTACPTRTDYGETTVYYQVTSPNYNTVTGSQKIIVAQKAITGVSATGVDTTYDGNNHSIDVTKPSVAIVTYKTSADGEYTSTNPKFKNAGTYTVYYKVEIDGNYTPVTGQETVVISPKEVGLNWSNTELTYNGTVQTPEATATGIVDGDTCTVTVTGGQKNANDSAYTATASELSNANYKLPTDVTKTFTIAKKAITVTPKDTKKHVESNDPELTYTVKGLVDGDTLTGIKITREEGEIAGKYEITATSDDTKDTNYNITISGEGTFTIEDHSWSEYVDDNNANTEADGTKTATCSVCDKKDVKVIPGTKIVVSKESTVEETVEVGTGKIVTETVIDKSIPKTEIDNLTVETAKTLLDEEELEEVEAGATVTVFLNVVNIENTVSAEDKAKIANIAATLSSDAEVGMYLDVSLFKKLSTEEGATRITDTNGDKISVSIAVPDGMVNADTNVTRTYYIARIHDGSTELIPATYDANTKTITFATDKFSTYALVYKDVAANATVTPSVTTTANNKVTSSPDTGDTTPIEMMVVIMIISACGIIAFKKKKE